MASLKSSTVSNTSDSSAVGHVQTVGQEPGFQTRVAAGGIPFLEQLLAELRRDGR